MTNNYSGMNYNKLYDIKDRMVKVSSCLGYSFAMPMFSPLSSYYKSTSYYQLIESSDLIQLFRALLILSPSTLVIIQ